MLDALYGHKDPDEPVTDPAAEENWKKSRTWWPAISSRAQAACPRLGAICGQQREPLGRPVGWTTEEGNPMHQVLRFTLDGLAENEGVMYLQRLLPRRGRAKYRFQCRWRSSRPAVKVFIKCYSDAYRFP